MSLLTKAKSFKYEKRKLTEVTKEDMELAQAYCNGEISNKQAMFAYGDKSSSATNTRLFRSMKKIIAE